MTTALRAAAWLAGIALLWPILLAHGLSAVPLVALVLGAVLLQRRSEPSGALFATPVAPGPAGSAVPFWTGLLVLAGALAALEASRPLYFVQDDNYAQFLPIITQGARSFFDGVFPTWNASQLLGQPTTSVGVYALTYPPTYLSFGIARYVLGNQAWTLDVFCIGHLLGAYVVLAGWLERDLRIRGWLAAQAALGFALSGFFLIGGRSWFYMVPLALWLPMIFQAFFRMLAAPSWKHAGLLGAGIGVFFHAGNAQMWLYTLLFLGCAAALFATSGLARRRHLLALSGALGLGLLIALPVLVPQLGFTADVSRRTFGSGTVRGIFALVFPHPLVTSAGPNDWGGADANRMTAFYYCGLTNGAAALALLLAWCRRLAKFPFGRKQLASPVVLCLLLGVLCLELSYGPQGLTYPLLSRLPVFSKFSNPFKFLGFLSFFLAVAGATFLQHWLPPVPRPNRDLRALAVMILVIALLVLHLPQTRVAFWTYADRPDRPLPAQLQALLAPTQRVASVTPQRSAQPGHGDTLPHNVASMHGFLQVEGYDPLVQAKPESQRRRDPATWRDYGVATVLVAPQLDAPAFAQQQGLLPVLELPTVHAYRLPEPRPLAFSLDGAVHVRTLRVNGQGIEIAVDPTAQPANVTVNFLWRDGMHAWVQDARGTRREVPVLRDALRRMVLALPPGTQAISIVYQPLWRFGPWLVLALSLLMVVLFTQRSRLAPASC